MPKSVSNIYKETVNSTGAAEAPLIALEITHPDLVTPIRVVNDNQDLVHLTETFVAMAFRIDLPTDEDRGLPQARLAVDNVGREMMQWLEASDGGAGAKVRIIQLLRSAPDTVEWEITMDLSNVKATMLEVTGRLGFEDLLNRPGVTLTYRPDTAPGLF